MGIAFAAVAVALAAGFGAVWRAARREWAAGDELSARTGWGIGALWGLTAALFVLAIVWRPLPLDVAAAAATIAGGTLLLAGAALGAPGFLPFASVEHLYGIDRGGLITEGVYRYSRNPQYAGLGFVLLGAALVARSGLALLVVASYWVAVRAWLVIEERHLHAAFGAGYAAYRDRAPRFLGRPRADGT